MEGPSACGGDSGGPLALADPKTKQHICLYGVTSHLVKTKSDFKSPKTLLAECLTAKGVRYSNVAHYEKWVMKHLGNDKQ